MNDGKLAENEFKIYFEKHGFKTLFLNDRKYQFNDIDLAVKKIETGKITTLSIKDQTPCLETGNIVYERYLIKKDGTKIESWGLNSRADVFGFKIGSEGYLIKRELMQFIYKDITFKVTMLKRNTVEIDNANREYNNAEICLIRLADFLTFKVAKIQLEE